MPTLQKSAKILYTIYICLTVVQILLLLAGGMPLFDSLTISFGTAGTGGFAIKNDSMAGYSPYLQNVCTVFMALFGINFSVFYLILLRQWKRVCRNEELWLYLGIMALATGLIAWDILPQYSGDLGVSLRHAAFQVSSIMTTTGFATTDFNLWPPFSKMILVGLMIVGACAGSTGGGIKCARVLLLGKAGRRTIKRMLRAPFGGAGPHGRPAGGRPGDPEHLRLPGLLLHDRPGLHAGHRLRRVLPGDQHHRGAHLSQQRGPPAWTRWDP